MQNVERCFFSMKEIHEMTGLSQSFLFQLTNDGVLDRKHVGRKALFTAESVRRLIEFGYPNKARPKKARPDKERPSSESIGSENEGQPLD